MSATASPEELQIARELVASARARGLALTGPEGLLKALTKTVIETALDEELVDPWAMTSTIRWAATDRTPATAGAPRRC